MSTITSNASCNPSSISVSGKTSGSGTISWSLPTVPAGGVISSCKLTGTCTVSDTANKPATVTVNGTSVSSGVAFTIDLGTGNATSSVTVAATGPHKNTRSTITFSNLVYTVTYAIYHTVTFVDWDGTVLKTQQVEEGTSATAPNNPTRDGYKFTGWDKAFNNVTSDLTVTAQYVEAVYYTVTFVNWDGTVLKTQTVESGKSATAPSNPTRDGYNFTGWDIDFSIVTSNLTVRAQYEETKINNLVAKYTANAAGVVPDFNSGYQYEINETESDGIYTVEITSEEDFSTFKFKINKTNLIGIEYLNVTSAVTSLDSSFFGCTNLQYVNGIDKWDISNSSLTRMYCLFNGCSLLSTDIDFSSLNNHNINMMMSAFQGCNELTSVNLDGFINSSVTNISYLFYDCSSLETITMNNCDLTNATVSLSFSMNTLSLKNIEMKNTNYTSVNKVIADLPTRTSENPGTLNIEGIDDFSQVDITTAQSKFWNIVGVSIEPEEPEEDDIEWTGVGTVATNLSTEDDWTYKLNIDWDTQYIEINNIVANVEMYNYGANVIYINNQYDFSTGDFISCDESYALIIDNGSYNHTEFYSNEFSIKISKDNGLVITSNLEGDSSIYEIKEYAMIENSSALYLSSLVRASGNSYSEIGEIKVVALENPIEPEEPNNNELIQGDINDETGAFEDEVSNIVKTNYIDISDKKQILVNVLTEDVYILKCYLYNANKELVKIIDISADKKRMFGLDLQKLIEEVMNDGNE